VTLLHAANPDELPTIEGTPTECADIVPDALTTDASGDVTCSACLAVMRAKNAGNLARHAISLGESSGIFRGAAVKPGDVDAGDG
jgi:hypothetical protein